MRLQDKVAIITGAGQGIGAATALRFAEEGAAVVLAARSEDKLAAVAATITAAGGRALVCPTDIADEDAVRALVEKTVATYGRLDIVVNNAVLMVPGMLANHDTKAWRQNFIVSLDGAMFLMREAYPQLKATAGYSAAKSAMLGLSRNAAMEWGKKGIRVNTVIPGAFMTPPTAAVLPDDASREATAKSIPIGRIGDPRECANAILFLASEEASYITGAELVVDGGRVAELNAGTASWE